MSRIDRRYVWLTSFAFGFALVFGFLGAAFAQRTQAASVAGFRPGNIITDAVMSEYNSMSESEIQSFLKSKNSCNNTNVGAAALYPSVTYNIRDGHFVCMADDTFNGETAAHIIWQTAQDYRINPKVLIVLLQKEQGLITDTWPNSRQYNTATGFACPDSGSCDTKYYGLKNQIRQAANLFRTVLDGGWTNYPVGNNYIQYNPNKSCGGSTVYIENRATSSLYRYTPYQPNASALAAGYGTGDGCGAYGNRNFYLYFTDWFGSTQEVSRGSVWLADGVYQLKSTGGKALGFDSSANGTLATLAENNSASNYQRYVFTRVGKYYTIKHVASGRFLDVQSASIDAGTKVQLYDGNGSCAQQWLVGYDNGKYTFTNACSVNRLDIAGAQVSQAGVTVQTWTPNSSAAQQWVLENLSDAPIADGTVLVETSAHEAFSLVDSKTNNGTRIHLWNIVSNNDQKYQFARQADGTYVIKSDNGRVLDVAGASVANGAAVQIYDSNNTCAQRWAVGGSAGALTFRSLCSGKAIDVPNAQISANGVKLQLYDFNNSSAQKFNLRSPTLIAGGRYTLFSKLGNNMVLDVANAASQNGTNIQLWGLNGTNAQKFSIYYDASWDAYTIKNLANGKALDVSNAGTRDGTNVQIWNFDSRTCAQYWRISQDAEGFYTFTSVCSQAVLDVSNAGVKNGTNIHIWNSNGTSAQKWQLGRA